MRFPPLSFVSSYHDSRSGGAQADGRDPARGRLAERDLGRGSAADRDGFRRVSLARGRTRGSGRRWRLGPRSVVGALGSREEDEGRPWPRPIGRGSIPGRDPLRWGLSRPSLAGPASRPTLIKDRQVGGAFSSDSIPLPSPRRWAARPIPRPQGHSMALPRPYRLPAIACIMGGGRYNRDMPRPRACRRAPDAPPSQGGRGGRRNTPQWVLKSIVPMSFC
jgi:hypothetical protein